MHVRNRVCVYVKVCVWTCMNMSTNMYLCVCECECLWENRECMYEGISNTQGLAWILWASQDAGCRDRLSHAEGN